MNHPSAILITTILLYSALQEPVTSLSSPLPFLLRGGGGHRHGTHLKSRTKRRMDENYRHFFGFGDDNHEPR